MSQRQILENSIDLLKTLRGPAKLLYADASIGMPTLIQNVINPTTGAPGASWIPFGLTRGGVNVVKNIDAAIRDDVDQIKGAYDQDITDTSFSLTTQMAEIIGDGTAQLAIALDLGSATVAQVASGGIPTQTRRNLVGGDYKLDDRRWAVVFPKSTEGKVFAFVFRRGQIAGGEKALRFDKNDPASPPLEIRIFPEIATTIASDEAYGHIFEIE